VQDFAAGGALVAAIDRFADFFRRVLAVERLSERAGHGLQPFELMAAEEVGVCQALALERALEQLNPLLVSWEIFKGHALNLKEDALAQK
jgi:hypothetical protein